MKQDMNDTFRIALRAMVVAAMTLLAGSTATAEDTPTRPRVRGNVYGGGNLATVGGSVTVNMSAGTVEKDVYGGGALANTNINNATNYGTESETVSSTSTNTTTVNLTGGTIMGDAYGGGLGQRAREAAEGVTALDDVPAYVYGDVTVKLNKGVATDAKGAIVNRVFAANNLNGSPKGNTSVYVYATQSADAGHTTIGSKFAKHTELEAEGEASTYDVQAVYGGGNEASYIPKSPYTAENTTGAKSQVIIEGCDLTSIKTVYGGGNAASVPETNVTVKSVYEIEDLFGGGNGKDDTSYGKNPGADIGVYKNASNSDVLYGTGNVNVTTQGGYIHELFGASNQKGSIKGDVALNMTQVGTCTLKIDKVYNAGRNADIEGNLISVLSCQPATKILEYYGGAENANVKGNVELTITNGWFEKVFAGNNQSGSIFGHIKLNVEETGCSPIRIDELYGCGNDAAYSVYGYYVQTEETENGAGLGDVGEHPSLNNEKLVLLPRTSADDPHKPVKTFNHETQEWTVYAGDDSDPYPRYDDPEVNIVSATYIGKVFGGGYGANGTVYGNPQVNINMIKGDWAGQTYGTGESAINVPNQLGEIGIVYGGGNEADVVGNTFVNIGTKDKVKLHLDYNKTSSEYEMSEEKTVEGAYITGNVYGGGKGEAKMEAGTAGEAFLCAKAMVKGDEGTHVNIGNGLVTGSVYGGGEKGRVEHNTEVKIGLDEADVPTGKTSAPIINGNVFGAGKGVNTHGYSALVRGTSTVTVQADAKVRGNVYGGGEMASVGKYKVENGLPVALAPDNIHPNSGYCYVNIRGNAEIGPDDMEMTKEGGPSDAGHVFGAGKGVLPYENADEEPFHMNGTQVLDENNEWDGKSWEDHPTTYPAYNSNAELDDDYVKFIKSLALATQTVVAIEGNPFIKGSVYGGSENGFVQQDTHVTISGGQIGNGYVQMDDNGNYLTGPLSVNRRYTTDEWSQGKLIMDSNDRQALKDLVSTTNYTSSLPECASWRFGAPYAPYDVFADASGNYPSGSAFATAEGGRPTGSDGHTFYGNVFGGGSGYYPYKAGRWFKDAGAVYGDTYVTIKGGHILTNVYGGNEMTDVGKYDDSDRLKLLSGGNCYVTMIGGTLGVPRTLGQIDKHPVTCYLFGAGKGDQRVFFNKSTNVGNVFVHISDDARIYGSIFGGGEDGHVMKNVTMNIGGSTLPTAFSGNSVLTSIFEGVTLSGSKTVSEMDYPYIGTWGTSYVDGNVFGAGRGFGGDAYTAGNVAGSVTMNIYGGTMLGSVYGGGRLGSVGYGLFDAKTSTGSVMPGYGEMRPDNTTETESGNSESLGSFNRGYVGITISGGTIGNKWEFVDVDPSTAPADLATWKTNHNVPNTEYEEPKVVTNDNKTLYYYQLKHTKGGNVFAGGMGRQKQIDGQSLIDPEKIDWKKLGNVKQTTLTITGGKIMSNVYGGGELGAVVPYVNDNDNTVQGGTTQISISGTAVIGTLIERSVTTTGEGGSDVTTKVPVYTFGSVYGGGMGNETDKTSSDDEARIGGLVKGSTTITLSGGDVKASVYGGGELAIVQGSHTAKNSKNEDMSVGTEINISGGTIGYNQDGFGGATMGNVYGGGKGSLTTANAGLIKNNTLVKITGTPTIYHNIYGGGAYGSVGTFTFTTGAPTWPTDNGTGKTEVIVEGGTIGINGHENGMVFGSSRGDVAAPVAPSQGATPVDPNDRLAWVYDTHVVIGNSTSSGGPSIKGTVYGSGENGHTFNNTLVDVNKGIIGIETGENITYTEKGKSLTKGGAAYPYRGNVYGGGCGTDMYDSNGDGTDDTFNPLAGIVLGDATVNINGGKVVRNVYGAGAMGSVGKTATTEGVTTVSGGTTKINVSDGTIGVDGTNGDGNVFGAARGNENATINEFALVKKETSVSVTGGTIKGNVYGGGELGCVGTFTVSQDMRTFDWQDTDGTTNTTANSANKNTGVCNVTVDGSSAVINGHVYGAGRGKDDTFWCEKGIAYSANVDIKNGTVNHNVYGGGEVGRVETDTQVKIGSGTGTAGGTFAPTITGSVFGGGAGVETHGYSALVRGNTTVSVEGNAKVEQSVYGGGQIASVGRYALDSQKMPSILQGGGYCYVTVQGHATIVEDVFGAGKGVTPHFNNSDKDLSKRSRRMSLKDGWEQLVGDARFAWDYLTSESDYSTYLETLALATHPEVTIDGNATVSGSVFGGGELGLTKGSVIVNIHGGTITEDVYGGGSLANTNTTNSVDTNGDGVADQTVDPTTTVNLKGGTINRNVYGGGLGRLAKDAVEAQPAVSAVEAKVYGEVLVNLNKPTTTTTGEGEGATSTTTYGDCEVKGTIFGCNNLNGSPQKDVTVHVYKTVKKNDSGVMAKPTKDSGTYEMTAVYGGGNLAAYYPDDATTRGIAQTNVIIDGCDLTSIKQVYGGGNAASVPATHVVVNGTYEIEEVFGGGNGLDKISKNGTLITNPGANVGFKDYWDYTNEKDLEDYDTKEERLTNTTFLANYVYGSGKASVDIYGGLVHRVFGGSNTRGNVREAAVTMLQDMEGCDFKIDEAYGGGKSAPMDAEAKLLMACIPGLSVAYGGAQDADVQGGVTMTITNGTFDRVFGGNNISGTINGPIVVNIEETGCRPIVIGQLYGGGNQAAYTAPWKDENDHSKGRKDGPTVNVKSFTSIGEIYGGGYGETAAVNGDTYVNIDVTEGKWASEETTEDKIKEIKFSEFKRTSNGGFELDGDGNRIEETKTITVTIPGHKANAIGAIGNVFGGGNAAKVDGNTNVNIGTRMGADEYMAVVDVPTNVAGLYTRSGEGTTESPYKYTEVTGTSVAPSSGTTYYKNYTIKGADIRGNVYGGGNNADVTGNTNVVIGKKAE